MGSKQIHIGLLLEEKTETQLRVGKDHMKDTRESDHLQAEGRGSRGINPVGYRHTCLIFLGFGLHISKLKWRIFIHDIAALKVDSELNPYNFALSFPA